MQALLFVSMFGMFFAIISGLVGSMSMGSMYLKERQIADTKKFMQDVASYYEDDVVQRKVFIPLLAAGEDYLTTREVMQNVNWLWADNASGNLLDPWGQPFRVKAVLEDHPITAGTVGGLPNIVQPQALGMVIASPGPDQTYGPSFDAAYAAITGSSAINDVMNLEADASSDDIVFTFNTRHALERRWQNVEKALNEIAANYARRFQQAQYDATFQAQVQDYYEYAYANGHFADVSGNLEAWKAPKAWYPNTQRTALLNAAPNFNNYVSDIQNLNAADDENIKMIRYNGGAVGEENTAFSITATGQKTDSGNSVNDVLRLQLVPQVTSAWRNKAGNFRFRVEVGR